MTMKKQRIKKETIEDKPKAGKIYALTGTSSSRCIANGNTWSESEVKDPADQELRGQEDRDL
tara:strand:- start:414 stop:599 length:186 start_codon:yes stop_codon:yes gene_type:complete